MVLITVLLLIEDAIFLQESLKWHNYHFVVYFSGKTITIIQMIVQRSNQATIGHRLVIAILQVLSYKALYY